MEHKRYVTRKRARFKSMSGQINIPYGTALEARDGLLFLGEAAICATTSQNAYDYFSHDDDGQGLERGGLVAAILARLEKKGNTPGYRARWNKVWASPLCWKYKRPEHDDHFLWSYDFYNAPIEDLAGIAGLVGAKPRPGNPGRERS